MFTLQEVKDELLKRYNQNVDVDYLEECVHIWNIDPVGRDQTNEMFFDETSVRKFYRGLKLQHNGYDEDVINEILDKTYYNQKEHRLTEEEITSKELQTVFTKNKNNKKPLNQSNPAKAEMKKVQNNNVIDFSSREKVNKIVEEKQEIKEPVRNNQKIIEKVSGNVADKVIDAIVDHLKTDAFLQRLDDIGSLRRDNEILSKQVEELLKVNQSLEDKVFELELNNRSYKKLWHSIYLKIK